MTKPLILAGFLALIFAAMGIAFATDLDSRIVNGSDDECKAHTLTRHRSGRQPRNLNEGLRRRECGYQARAAARAARAPMEFDYVVIGVERKQLPAIVDSNSPAFWAPDGLRLFNSAWEETYQSNGNSVEDLDNPVKIDLPLLDRPGGVWLESVWLDPDTSVLYGWYHFEPADLICQTAPLIGAAVSYDHGFTWEDRGIVLDTNYGIDCDYDNGYFVGGNGDFSVILGPNKRFFYFMFTTYAGSMEEQGIGVARSPFADKGHPGTVFKYYNGAWTQPGLGGKQDIIFGTSTGWKGPFVEAYWGPSVHWNTHVNSYVALLNHTEGEGWEQEGVYISFSRDMVRWTEPRKLLEVNDWYPQVVGLDVNESDTLAGKNARIYIGGISDYILQFTTENAETGPQRAPATATERPAIRLGLANFERGLLNAVLPATAPGEAIALARRRSRSRA